MVSRTTRGYFGDKSILIIVKHFQELYSTFLENIGAFLWMHFRRCIWFKDLIVSSYFKENLTFLFPDHLPSS